MSDNAFAKPEYAVNWLRERAKINRDNAHIPPEQWEARVLPYIADRLDAAADEIERLAKENADLIHDLERSMANHVADLNNGKIAPSPQESS